MELATAVALNEDVVAVITSNHNNVDTRCWCTCWLAQVIWCIGETQGDAHTIASSVLALAVATVRSQGPQPLSQQILIILIPCVICSIASAFRRRSPTSNCFNYSQHHGNDRREDVTLSGEMGIQPLRLCSGTHPNSRGSILTGSRNHCVVCHVCDHRL